MSSLVSLVNACLMPAYDGRTPPDWVKRALDQGLAGVGLFGTNLLPPGGPLREDIVDPLRAVRPDALIALDEEGGDVTRLDYHRGSVYPGNHALGAVDDTALTRQVAEAVADDLLDTGINLCLGPCADVNSRPANPIIGVRSFGATPDLVARHTSAFVAGLQGRGVAATLKHFPGHGDTGTDSHSWLPDIPRSLDALRALELPPFAEGFAAGAKAVMTGHIRLPQVDDLPATLSRRVVTGLLREELGYDGVVISDALEMAPILDRWGFGGAAVLAWSAGVDLVLLGATDGEKILPEVYEAVEHALREGELTVGRLEEAAARITALRAWAAPATGTPGPAAGIHTPVADAPAPTAGTSLRAGGPPLLAAVTPASASATPLLAAGTSVPVVVTPALAAGTSVPASATPVLAAGTSVPASATPVLAAGTSVPVVVTPVLAAGTSVPASATPVLAAGTSVPVAVAPAPAAVMPAPATVTPAPATGKPVPAAGTPTPPATGIGLAAARRALAGVALPALPLSGPVHALRLAAGTNMAVGEAPWGISQCLERLGRLASAAEVEPGTDPGRVPLPEAGEDGDAPLVVVVRDAARDPWQQETLAALRALRPGLVAVEMGLTPVPPPDAPTLLTRGAGLANAMAAAELLTGSRWSGPLRT